MTRSRKGSKRYSSFIERRLSIDVAPILFIVRIHGKKNVPPQISSRLDALRLNRPFYGVIRRNTPKLQHYLKYLDNYITYGIPSRELIGDLIMKRGKIFADSIGYGKHGRHSSRSVIKSNVMIENIFKQTKYANKIICIEDIIDILSKNPYKVTSEIENRKLNQLRQKLLENTIFEEKNKNKKKNIKENENENEKQLFQMANENRSRLESIMANNFADEENEELNKNKEKKIEIEENHVRNECYIKNLVKIVSENETIFDEIERKKIEQVEKYDTVCSYINPFELNGMRIPMKGLTGPFDHKGYYGYRGQHINKFVEKLI